ncbi:MAG: class I SAM-dependent methyltransferase [Planctomycetota bacterium]|jgi:ubiquinone/menaquinone biosynthesis C-methylase UbiE
MNDTETARPEILRYYELAPESDRLATGIGRLELARTREIIERHLPPAPAVVLDVGGGPGVYAAWLAELGHEVHLVDPVARLVAVARSRPGAAIASCRVGDARRLERDDASTDAVLMLGPLYHLTEAAERQTALREAHRVLRAGGLLVAAAIGRYASALDGLLHGLLEDPQFAKIVEADLATGRHVNPTDKLEYFTTAYFHAPDELAAEVTGAGFRLDGVLAVEGPGWLLGDLDARWEDERQRRSLLTTLRSLESGPSLVGVSAHLVAVARKPDGD